MWGVAAAAPAEVAATPVTAQPAVDTPVASARSAETTMTPQAKKKVRRPGKPQAVTANAGHERLTVRWKKPTSNGGARIRGYRVQLRELDGTWTTVRTTKAKARSHVLTGLDNGNPYTVRVAARNAKGYGRSSKARAVLPTSLDVSIRGTHGCAVVPNGTVRCWGLNPSGQLGDGSTDDSVSPVQVSDIDDAVAVGVGVAHSCAVLGDGSVWCWGSNGTGALGVDSPSSSAVPVQAVGVTGAVDVVAGDGHTCALLESGAVWCWGFGADGQLGRGDFNSTSTPGAASAITDATSIAAGSRHTCAVVGTGRVRCWGANTSGSLGLGGLFNLPRNAPVLVPDLLGASRVGASENTSCAVRTAGTVACWGDNLGGGLGNGETATSENTATEVLTLTDAVSVTVGRFHTCALRTTGDVSCWGSNVFGQLGLGDISAAITPTPTVGVGKAVQVEAGGANTCARTRVGTLLCWGDTALVGTTVDPLTQTGVPVRPDGF
jgi:alpha-tubulin suppressor-like RCC1 family protein